MWLVAAVHLRVLLSIHFNHEMHTQCRHTVCTGTGTVPGAVSITVEEKLRRIMLIRSNKREANAAAQNGASNHRKCFNKNSPRWYSNERNEAHYDSFYRYRTKYDNFHSYENRNNADL